MKPGAPWSVKGIEPQARETAKSAARRAGMTLGEWLNQVILETGTDAAPVSDPMRAPDDWMRETGEALPWTRPIEDMSSAVIARLSSSEIENAALFGSIETAISGISKRLTDLDARGPSSPGGALEARLSGLETVQKRALSKDHLRALETAVSQISVVFDNNTEKQNTTLVHQSERIDQTHGALAEVANRLEETEDRVGQALCAVEAAAELYEITDKQGQIIDSLVMDIAAVHAGQNKSDARSAVELSSIADEIGSLSGRFKAFEADAARTTTNSADSAEDVRLAASTITDQISENEDKTSRSVAQIEEQIVGLSQVLDRSLQAQQSGIKDLRASFDAVLQRLEKLEANPRKVDHDTAATGQIEEAAPAGPLTFKSLEPQSTRNVNVNMAVTIDPDFIRTEEESDREPVIELSEDPVLVAATEPAFDVTVEPKEVDAETATDALATDLELLDETDAEDVSPPLVSDEPADFEAKPQIMAEVELEAEVDVPAPDGLPEGLPDNPDNAETLEDTPLTFADIFGSNDEGESADLVGEIDADEAGDPVIDYSKDAALREAVTNISSIRASWAAKSEAERRPGSMRQIVDVGDDEASKRGWALTASGMIVGLFAISGVLVYSGDTNDLIEAGERPGLFDQITSWIPGRPSPPLASNPSENHGGAQQTTQTSDRDAMTSLPAGLEEAASAGDAKASFALGRALANGDGRAVNKDAARKWYEAAAGQDLAIAQYVLGSLHERGIDVEQDSKAAIDWYALAARGGNRRSMHNLAVAYARGDVITQDLPLSTYWFSEAAALGLSDAQYNLALLHERGLGTEKDLVSAWKWYRIAAMSGDEAAASQAERIGEKLTPGQLETAAVAVRTWQPREMEPIANGLFDISPIAWDNSRQRGDLATVQTHLMTMGYDLAASDGIMDPTTRKAIKAFQASNNLVVTGKVSPGLFETLTDSRSSKSPAD